jgi:hypothetical protein
MNYTIDEPIQTIESQIEVLTDYLDHKFADAEDVSYGRYLIKQYDRLEAAKKLLIALKGTIEEVLQDEDLRYYKKQDLTKSTKRLRTISVSITEGMIKQNLLTLTEAKKRGLVKIGEHFAIETDQGECFETQMVKAGNRLRERSQIARFYKHHDAEDGDRVTLQEIKPGYWKLSFDEAYKKAQAKVFEEIINAR